MLHYMLILQYMMILQYMLKGHAKFCTNKGFVDFASCRYLGGCSKH